MSIPTLFHLWFRLQFDFQALYLRHENLMTRICVRHFINTASNQVNILYKAATQLIETNPITQKWRIHPNFPRDKVVEKVRSYLYHYFLISYDLVSCEEEPIYKAKIYTGLVKMFRDDPLFGIINNVPCTTKFPPCVSSFTFDHTTNQPTQFIFGSNNETPPNPPMPIRNIHKRRKNRNRK